MNGEERSEDSENEFTERLDRLWNKIDTYLKKAEKMRHTPNPLQYLHCRKCVLELRQAQEYCKYAYGKSKSNDPGDAEDARSGLDKAEDSVRSALAALKDVEMASIFRDLHSDALDKMAAEHSGEIEDLKNEIDTNLKIISEKGFESENVRDEKQKVRGLEEKLKKEYIESSDVLLRYARELIDKGHSVDASIYKTAERYGVEKDKIKRKFLGQLQNYYNSHKSYMSTRGEGIHFYRRLKSGRYNKKETETTDIVEELGGLEEEIKEIEEGPYRTEEQNETLNRKKRKIERIRGELQVYEDHPGRIGGFFARGAAKLGRGRKRFKEVMNNKFGGDLAGSSSRLREGAHNVGGKFVSGYSKAKEMTAATLSFVFAFLIFFGMLYITWGEGSVYFPINKWQVIVFLFLATLLALIKISLSEDKDSLKEAKEITGIFIIIGVIIALSIGYASEGISFWGSLIFCILCGVYLFLDFMTDSVIASFLLFIGMAVLVWFTMSGWMDMVGMQVEKLAIETGFDEAITTSVAKISEGASDVWLMLRHPNQWFYEKQMEQNMQKDEGQSEGALEITRTTMWPSIVSVGDVVNLAIDVENFGEYTAKNAEVYVKIDKEDSGDVHLESPDNEKLEAERYIGNILPETTAQEVFSVYAPDDCTGTFRLTSGVSYGYEVVATGDIVVISQERYDELVRQKKLNTRRHVTTSGGGPISVNVRTNLDEPIPIPTGDPKPISVHIAILNHRKEMGSLTLTSMTVKLPKNFDVPDQDKCDLDCTEEGDYIECDFDGEDNLIGDSRMFVCYMQYNTLKGDELYFEKPLPFQVDIGYTYSYEKKVSFSVKAGFIDEDNPPKKCD